MLLLGVILLPLLLALLLLLPAARPLVMRLGPWAPLPALLLALAGPAELHAELSWLVLGTHLGLDDTGRIFLLFTALIWLAAGLYARVWLAAGGRRARFAGFFLVAQAGNLGVCLAQGAAGFYFFFALMTFAAYGLVIHAGDASARRAGWVYLILAVLGEVLILSGVLLLVDAWGSAFLLDFSHAGTASGQLATAAWCLLLGFGVKAGLPLLHYALPLIYSVAAAPAAAVLAGAMLKAGLLGWLRFLPLGEVALPEVGATMMLLGVIAMFGAVAIGLAQRQAAALLAYSSISQMGYFLLALGAALRVPALWPALAPALVLYAAHHALAKSALFLGLGMARRLGATPSVLVGLAWPALALAGAPLTGGLLAKLQLKQALADPLTPWAAALPGLLGLGALATALLMLRLFVLLRREPGQPECLRTGLWAPWLLALLGVAALPVWLAPPELWREMLTPSGMLEGFTPLLIALALAGFGARMIGHMPAIPPGDLLVWLERLFAMLARALERLPKITLAPVLPRAALRSPWLEARLRTLPVAGVAWLGLLGVLAVMLAV